MKFQGIKLINSKCYAKNAKKKPWRLFFKSSTGTNIAEWGSKILQPCCKAKKKKKKTRTGKSNIVVQKSISVLEYLLKTLSKIELFTPTGTWNRSKGGKIEGKQLSIFIWNNLHILLCQHHVLVLLLPTENNIGTEIWNKTLRTGFLTSGKIWSTYSSPIDLSKMWTYDISLILICDGTRTNTWATCRTDFEVKSCKANLSQCHVRDRAYQTRRSATIM